MNFAFLSYLRYSLIASQYWDTTRPYIWAHGLQGLTRLGPNEGGTKSVKGSKLITSLSFYKFLYLKLEFEPPIHPYLPTLNHTLHSFFEGEGTEIKVESLSKLNTFDLSLV